MTVKDAKTISGDALLLVLTVVVAIGLLWPHAAVWTGSGQDRPATALHPIAWDTEKVLPVAITPLSPLYQVAGPGDGLTLRVDGKEAEMALLVWLEGEWVVMPWAKTDRGYQAYFNGWLPDYVTVAGLPTALRRK